MVITCNHVFCAEIHKRSYCWPIYGLYKACIGAFDGMPKGTNSK